MQLFEIQRTTKAQDSDIVSKSRKKSTVVPVSTTGSKMQNTISIVNQKLGKYKDEYIALRTEEEVSNYIDSCIKQGIAAIDTETTGLNVWKLDIGGICIYTYGQKAAYIPINHKSHITGNRYTNQCDVSFIREQLERCQDIKWIMHNGRYDIKVLKHTVGVRLHCYWDTMLAAYCIQENGSHALKDLHLELCPEPDETESVKYSDLFKAEDYLSVPIETAVLYAAGDAKKTMDLYDYQVKVFAKPNMQKVYSLFKDIEMQVLDVVVDMEEYGVLIDKDYSNKLSIKYHNKHEEVLQKADSAMQVYYSRIDAYKQNHPECCIENPINLNSPKQLSELFYDVLKLDPVDKKSPRGTGEEILKHFANNNICKDLCEAILEVREIEKLLSTYIDKLPNSVEEDGRIHCNFNQYGAKTGRFSSSDPNLQNIPSHNKEIRKMFTAPEGRVFVGADFSQQEPLVTAHLSNDAKMRESFESGRDIYSTIASVSFDRTYEDCLEHFPEGTPIKQLPDGDWVYGTVEDHDKLADGVSDTFAEGKEYRSQAKKIVLGILYGRALPSIAEQLNTDIKGAKHIYDAVLDAFPELGTFMNESQENARMLGYVETAWGRRRHLPDMQLKPYEFTYRDVKYSNFDPLSFSKQNLDVPISVQNEYTNRLLKERNFRNRQQIKDEASKKGIKIKDNTKFIEDATRQCVNSRVQGSAADITKKAMIALNNDEIMKSLDFHLVIQVHDEVIGECPIENAKACAERLSYIMSTSAKDKISIKMKCDATITQCWYGEEINVNDI